MKILLIIYKHVIKHGRFIMKPTVLAVGVQISYWFARIIAICSIKSTKVELLGFFIKQINLVLVLSVGCELIMYISRIKVIYVRAGNVLGV